MRSKQVSLSHIWINKMAEYFATAERYYGNEMQGEDFLQMEDGDRISYTFKNPVQTDMFWGHAFGILTDATKVSEPAYLYNPHEWFMLIRHESERHLFDEVKNKGKQLFLISGNRDPLDVWIQKEFDDDLSQYYANDQLLFGKNNYYLNIFDDYLIEVWLDQTTSDEIDRFYKETKEFDDNAQTRIKKIFEKRGKNRLVISKNRRKAEKLKKVFGKYFLIK